jgi:nitrite reductase/ring-hydroxylating ferredoxin subunit
MEGLAEPESIPGAQVLCPLASLEDPGSRGFEVEIEGRMRSVFIVRAGDTIRGYMNDCPHVGAELNWQPDRFLDADGRHILCAVHGALFEIESGRCIHGPCRNQSLTPVPVMVERGQVVLGHGD